MQTLLAIVLLAASSGSVEGTLTVSKDGEPGSAINALIFLEGFDTAAPGTAAVMTQSGRSFSPTVLPVVRRQWVEFVNSEPDPIYHQVFSPSDRVKKFDTGRFKPPQRRKVQFGTEGRVDVFCDIHREMIATVYIVPNDRFVVVSEDGPTATFRIDGVPPGTHRIVAWHRSTDRPVTKEIVVREGETTSGVTLAIDATTGLEELLLRHRNRNGKEYTDEQRARERSPW